MQLKLKHKYIILFINNRCCKKGEIANINVFWDEEYIYGK